MTSLPVGVCLLLVGVGALAGFFEGRRLAVRGNAVEISREMTGGP